VTRARPGGVGRAAARYTALRVGVFVGCFGVAAAVVLPLTGGRTDERLLAAALVGAVVSVPLSLLFGRRLRAELAAALGEARDRRLREEADYRDRVRNARGQEPPGGTSDRLD